ncbi:class I SAM-dependent methyltransferase [Aestuariirhabdus sp. Z084]|uniref:class I SAM-dependent methyltransferase n=1 Tax=Aestuariirhabdus haliotis TaxID=2918751 RepID=UPI00201B4005|nr:class I SAM-dependent methyltransferase [Aestuariirhabdus haliotis]MCL6417391.1 class I SAM-dependent methyltransferase [Aestuariirhabdus haliotis]MCL6421335.1 class I SAM-dependent methyltransferase [Aestuariirhabdus haliotis]
MLELLVIALDPSLEIQANERATELGLNFVGTLPLKQLQADQAALVLGGDGWSLAQGGKGAPGPVRVDFASGAADHRRRFGGGKSQSIIRALGLKGSYRPNILDATAGLGRDAFVFATQGCEVTLLERSAVVHTLLTDGMNRGRLYPESAEILQRMHLFHASAFDFLQQASVDQRHWDVVYLDPMFPHRSKSALVKKEMRVFRELLGDDLDADDLLSAAWDVATYRVVVKRPRQASWLGERKPDYSLEGKSGRFDLYVRAALPATTDCPA